MTRQKEPLGLALLRMIESPFGSFDEMIDRMIKRHDVRLVQLRARFSGPVTVFHAEDQWAADENVI